MAQHTRPSPAATALPRPLPTRARPPGRSRTRRAADVDPLCVLPSAAFPTQLDPQETNVETAVDLYGAPLPLEKTPFLAPDDVETAIERIQRRYNDNRNAGLTPHEAHMAYVQPPATQLELDFRHSCWHVQRMATLEAMKACDLPAARIERFENCGNSAVVQHCAATDEIRVCSNHCHDRWCKICGNERSHVIVQNLLRLCEGKQVRFMTLTLKHNSERLNLQVDRLLNCFRRLRNRSIWDDHVTGAAMFLEVKVADDGRTWHPHLHIIYEGTYFPKGQLSSHWYAITGDSFVVDVRWIADKEKAAGYVAKYASKPLDKSLYRNPEMLKEALIALKGRRLCSTLGSWRGLELEETPPDDRVWITIASLDHVKRRATEGDEKFKALLQRVAGKMRTAEDDSS
jgi:hypothetical protein